MRILVRPSERINAYIQVFKKILAYKLRVRVFSRAVNRHWDPTRDVGFYVDYIAYLRLIRFQGLVEI